MLDKISLQYAYTITTYNIVSYGTQPTKVAPNRGTYTVVKVRGLGGLSPLLPFEPPPAIV